MKRIIAVTLVGALLGLASSAYSQGDRHSFSFQARNISGFPSGAISLVGGGAFDLASGRAHAGGGFSCLKDVNQGPLAGCRAGEGVRWDVDEIIPSVSFKCTGAASEPLKTALTGGDTVVIHADFYRAGDGTHESFQANMIVSGSDLDPDQPGIQNVWVQGVGCGEARTVVH
jgi:hypothetical protein